MARRPPSQRQYFAQPMPGFLPFMHPRLVAEPPSSVAWLHEIKFDGYRMQVRVEGGVAALFTRNGHDWTVRLPEIAAAAAVLPDGIYDGELCALGADGQPDFGALRSALSPGRTAGLVLFVFDLLWRGADDLRRFALADRKAILAERLGPFVGGRLRAVESFPAGGRALLQSACRLGLEGIVSKRRDSRYVAGRGDAWVKSKCRPGQEFVIGGWVQERLRPFKAILVGVFDGQRLRYAGAVKTGFRAAPGLIGRLEALETEACPFAAGDPPRKTREIRWARPELVAVVDFAEWTAAGKLRQASFKGLREDKDPAEVRRETPGPEPI
jgi:bifunctional non-homologous end joining protein LigD